MNLSSNAWSPVSPTVEELSLGNSAYFTKSAAQGNLDAENAIGECYYNGYGVSKSTKKAIEHYTIAANGGSSKAQYSLGFCYEKGHGILHSKRKAIEWYTKAAEQGHEEARKALERLK